MNQKSFFIATLGFFISGIFIFPVGAQELNVNSVSAIWPYPSQVLKVHSGAADIKQSGKTVRLADVIAKSPTTNKCVAYATSFRRGNGDWTFDSVSSQTEVSCKTMTVDKSKTTYDSDTGNSGQSDPRVPVEDSLDEVNRTVGDVEEVHQTIERVKNIKKLF